MSNLGVDVCHRLGYDDINESMCVPQIVHGGFNLVADECLLIHPQPALVRCSSLHLHTAQSWSS
jgi:hypothetical protein